MKRFNYAFQGLFVLFSKDSKFLIHSIFAIIDIILGLILCIIDIVLIFVSISIILGLILGITAIEWLLIIIAIGLVLAFEAMNTAVEFVVDLITKDYHELAKKAKDTAASSVVLASIVALAIGVIVFLPYLIK